MTLVARQTHAQARSCHACQHAAAVRPRAQLSAPEALIVLSVGALPLSGARKPARSPCFSCLIDTKLTTLQHLTVQVQACSAAEAVNAYVPGPVSVGPEIYAGALAGVIPFAIGSWEFGKRIVRGLMLTFSCLCSCTTSVARCYTSLAWRVTLLAWHGR